VNYFCWHARQAWFIFVCIAVGYLSKGFLFGPRPASFLHGDLVMVWYLCSYAFSESKSAVFSNCYVHVHLNHVTSALVRSVCWLSPHHGMTVSVLIKLFNLNQQIKLQLNKKKHSLWSVLRWICYRNRSLRRSCWLVSEWANTPRNDRRS